MGLFSTSSQTRTYVTDNRNAVAEGGALLAPRLHVTDGGRGAQVNAAGSVAVSGAGNTVSLNTTDFGAVRGAFDFAAVALSKGAELANTAIGSSNATNQQLADLAETKLTDGANLSQRTVIIGVTVLAALIAVVYWLRK